MSRPTIYPTGTTIYNPEKAYNGYTLYNAINTGAILVDMNGNVVKYWKDLQGFPNKLLPNGDIMGSLGVRNPQYGHQDQTDVVQIDWDGNVKWKFNQLQFIEDPGEKPQWMARQHHDYQRQGNPVGYYVPGMECETDKGTTLILCHQNVHNSKITDKLLEDDTIIEVDWEGNILWRWNANEHFSEFGFSQQARNVLFRDPAVKTAGAGDWLHINCASYLGPNKWYDAGDERFHPDNIIFDSRQASICGIISKKTGKLVWKIGPEYNETLELRMLGPIIGPHHTHMIPKGLPGEGNILIYDNGGWSGYGLPSEHSAYGVNAYVRDSSRVVEFNPVTLEKVWECNAGALGHNPGRLTGYRFYSPMVSSAQRLPNGNTLITEGMTQRFIEVTRDFEVVWEYIDVYTKGIQHVYRAYRYPYDYAPQARHSPEVAIEQVDIAKFRMPGAGAYGLCEETTVSEVFGWSKKVDTCVTEDNVK